MFTFIQLNDMLSVDVQKAADKYVKILYAPELGQQFLL